MSKMPTLNTIREQFGVDYLLHKKREPMIQLPEHVVKELLEALDEAIDTFGKSCEDCDLNGEFSFSRGRLYSIKNVIENTAKEIKQ